MVYTFCTNMLLKNTNLWDGKRLVRQLDQDLLAKNDFTTKL